MKKAFDQTVRDIKREVNKKVLKVPGIEQKVLDATSNEPWGPHGSHLADIANASRNYHEYQMIMGVIWKRINDTGKNWRHVYKALTVLEYLVANGSERVVEEIREHAYQISTLSEFQYIDSSGRDQGSNVRKKSQSLVLLVNDKERIVEVRQKAAANRDKFRSASSTGGMYRPNSYSSFGGSGDKYDDDRYEGRYGGRDDDRNSYGRDDDRYGKYGDSNSRDGDRYSRDSEDRYGRDGYREEDYRGRSRSVDNYNYGSRSRSSDRDRERAYDDDGNSSSRGGGTKVDEHLEEGRQLDRTFSEQNIGAPPSYEEAVTEGRSPVHSERDGETSVVAAPKSSSPPASSSPSQATTSHSTPAPPVNQSLDNVDEFDPRGSTSAPPNASSTAEVDLLGSLSDSYALALMPTVPATATSVSDLTMNANSAPSFAAVTSSSNQSFEDPFGETPFRAIPTANGSPTQTHNFSSTQSFQPTMNQSFEQPQPVAPQANTISNFDFGDNYGAITYAPPNLSNSQFPSTEPPSFPQEISTPDHDTDILAGILPPSGPSASVSSQNPPPVPGQAPQPNPNVYGTYHPEPAAPLMTAGGQPALHNSGFFPQHGFTNQLASQVSLQTPTGPPTQHNSGGFPQQPVAPNMATQTPIAQHSSGNFLTQYGATQYAFQNPGQAPSASVAPQPSATVATGQLAIVPQPTKDKFETKSTVWTDTLNRGLVNLNISGAKINPLADIGIDFDALNRKEKRMEKPAATPVPSTVTMGKAMGSGSGMGRAGASIIRPAVNPVMGSGMGMGMGMSMGGGAGLGPGMSAAGYGGMNPQQMGMGMGMGMGGGMNMNMGMGRGVQMQQPTGLPPGSNVSGGYNPMMGGGYTPQQPYGGGYAPQQPYGGGYR